MTDKISPQNIEAEESILGGIMLDPSALSRIIDILPADAFYILAHQHIYTAALELHHQNKPTDFLALTSRLSDQKLLTKAGGRNRLSQLVDRTVSAVNIDHLASLVLEKYQRRQLISAAHQIADLGYDVTLKTQSVLEQAESKIFQITAFKQDKFKPQVISTCLHEVFLELQQGHQSGFSTGLTDLDGLTGGLIKQDLIVIAARASMGKTWLACHFANYIAMQQKLPVVFFSAEMSKPQLIRRFLAMHSGIDSSRLRQNQVYRDEIENLKQSLMTLKQLPIIIDDTPASIQNPSRMCSVLRRIKSERGNLGLVVMDYIQKLGDRAAGNRAQAIGKFSGAFKDIAKEFDVPFVALAQINRGVENQTNKRPTMADIKDSGDIEQDMDIGLLLYRDEYYNSDTQHKGVMEINIAKNRNGATGICQVLFSPSTGTFHDAVVSIKQ
ncbi:replicative DNA helicase [Scytonema sp. UIC 10036]|uniref:replicative DNA helicase n=1 Tax=Scytonema sp. UIC 10036 TaxID=2304196 RepID=UPI0012DA6A9F|nr:replicative DNA helicase [Scytonema sp. UIC 10036]MUG91615.1 replicative DNA helicase [Scytonema sp. UIC 10036]